MKRLFNLPLLAFTFALTLTGTAQTTFTLNPYPSFGSRGDGSIQPGDSIGISPFTGNNIIISAPGVASSIQPGDVDVRPTGSTNGYNMRGLSYDPVSGNLVFVDNHEGQAGANTNPYTAGIYILSPTSGQILGMLNTTNVGPGAIVGGNFTLSAAAVADDGAVYVCNQTTASTTTGFKIYRWATADLNNPAFGQPPAIAFTNVIAPSARYGLAMDARGSGPGTQLIVGSASTGATTTNVLLFTTTDGTNFSVHVLSFPGITTAMLNDGIAFGPGNTCFAKQVGQPLLYLAWNPTTYAGSVISVFKASSVNDSLLNIAGLAYDPVNHLLAGVEEIGGIANGGRGKVWLYDFPDPTNHAPAVLASRTYIPNFLKATATMGYLDFAPGRLYANVVNNGLLASTVDSVPLSPPSFITDLPASTRVAAGQSAHFEVFAVADVTNYQWYSNNIAITGATTYYLDLTNVPAGLSGTTFKVVAFNAAGSTTSADSTLTLVSAANFFHPDLLWSQAADSTNYISSNGGANSPAERTIAYNALSNQLLVVRGPSTFSSLRIFVLDADTGAFLYTLKTNGITPSGTLNLCGIGVAEDGAVYASTVNSGGVNGGSDQSFKVYRWPDSGSNTLPQVIFGTNSSAANGNPIADLVGANWYRFGDTLAVRGSGNNTEILLDSTTPSKFSAILTPVPDGTMTNWTQTGSLLQNTAGSYGSEVYGTTVGRSLQFGTGNTFWQKRFNGTAGAPLAEMSYNGGGGLAVLALANTSPGIFTNGPLAVSPTLNVAATLNFVGGVGSDNSSTKDTLDYYDFTDPSQAVFLSKNSFPQGNALFHKGNGSGIGQVIFGYNPGTGQNYIFAIDGNNGVAAYTLDGGVTPPPRILAQSHNLKLLEGGSGTLSVVLDQPVTGEWFKGTNPAVSTGVLGVSYDFNNVQTSAVGDYFMIATNLNGAVTSQVMRVTVSLKNDNYTLTQAWGAGPGTSGNPGSWPYVSSDGGANTPNERAFAYNALSNQLIVVKCAPGSSTYTVSVVDAATGTRLYTLNTAGVIHEGPSEVSGSNPIDLVGATAADDGAIYICCESPNASGGAGGASAAKFHLYRWANSAPTTAPVVVFEGDPSSQPAGINERWGDVLAARGSGTNTEIFLNSQSGTYGAVLKPLDATLAAFTNYWFYDVSGGGSIGRSVQFGPTNSVFEKRKSASLVMSAYTLTNQSSVTLLGIDSPSTLGGVAVDLTHHLAAGVDFVGSLTAPFKPDAVALYDISETTSPMLIGHYNFPSNEVANANVICQTIISGNRVYALDANNGMLAFYINPPVNSMIIHTAQSAANINLSWGNAEAILQGTPTLNPSSWTDLTTAGQTNFVQPTSALSQYYRLIQRR
jgi:hypothetical protein